MIYITTIAFNNHLFVELQYKSILKYILDDNYKFIVFDDSKDSKITLKIHEVCNKFNIEYIRIDQNIHTNRNLVFKNPITETRQIMINKDVDKIMNIYNNYQINNTAGSRHCDSIQFIFNYFLNNITNCSYLFNIDSDMFLINKLNISDYIKGNDIGFVKQSNGGVTYIWPNIFIFDLKNTKNLNEICWDGCKIYKTNAIDDNEYNPTDTGGETHEYLKKYYNDTNSKLKIIDKRCYCNLSDLELNNELTNDFINLLTKILNYTNNNMKETFLIYNGKFTVFHLRGYTWTNIYENVEQKIDNCLIEFYNDL